MGASQSRSESQASRAAWRAFDELDDDMSGTISRTEFKHMVAQRCASGGLAVDEIEAEADVLWDAVDSKQRGVVDAEEWTALIKLVEKWRKERQEKKALERGKIRTTLEVIAPGAIARAESDLSSKKIAKLAPGCALQEIGRDALPDGTQRIHVQWDQHNGWISAKTVRHCTGEEYRISTTTDALLRSGRWGDLIEWLVLEQKDDETPPTRPTLESQDQALPSPSSQLKLESSMSSSPNMNHTQSFALLNGNLRFLKDLEPERLGHLSTSLRRLVGDNHLSENSLPAVLKELETKMGEHSLSTQDRCRLREALLGASGVAWRRRVEHKIAERLDLCCASLATNLADESIDEKQRRARHRARAARALHAAGIAKTPDPNVLTTNALRQVVARLDSYSGSQILSLSHWASADEILRNPQVTAWFQAREKGARDNVSPSPSPSMPPTDPTFPVRNSMIRTTLTSAMTTALSKSDDAATIRNHLYRLYSSASESLFATDAPRTVRRIWLCSDLHVDFEANLRHVLDFVPHPTDALIVAGDVAPTIPLFTKVMKSLVSKFALVFFCPGNHCLWVQKSERQTSLEKFFQLLHVCDKLGVITYPVHVGDQVYVAPLFSWYDPVFIDNGDDDQLSRHRLRFFDATCLWPAFLDDQPTTNTSLNGLSIAASSLVPGIARFFRKLNQPAIKALRARIEAPVAKPAIVISFSHFLPQRQLFEGPGGVRILGHVMGDQSLAADIHNLQARIHCFGHSHLNVDTVLVDGVRYVQNALGHQDIADAGKPLTFQPIIIWDSEYAQPVPATNHTS